MTNKYGQLAPRARQLVLLSYAALLVMLTVNIVVIPSCEREANTVVWLLSVAPLLAFLPWIVRQKLRAHAWFCFLLLFYFLLSVPVAFACTSTVTILEVCVVVVLFSATMLYIRWQSRFLSAQ